MKKNRHILINITDDDYNIIKVNAERERRTLTNYLYILIIDSIRKDEK